MLTKRTTFCKNDLLSNDLTHAWFYRAIEAVGIINANAKLRSCFTQFVLTGIAGLWWREKSTCHISTQITKITSNKNDTQITFYRFCVRKCIGISKVYLLYLSKSNFQYQSQYQSLIYKISKYKFPKSIVIREKETNILIGTFYILKCIWIYKVHLLYKSVKGKDTNILNEMFY